MRRSLKSVLSRVNQLAERAQAGTFDLAQIVTVRLHEARKRCAAGMQPKGLTRTDDQLRQSAKGSGEAMRIAERLIAARKRAGGVSNA